MSLNTIRGRDPKKSRKRARRKARKRAERLYFYRNIVNNDSYTKS